MENSKTFKLYNENEEEIITTSDDLRLPRKPLLELLEEDDFHPEQVISPEPTDVDLAQIDRILGKIQKLEKETEKNSKYLQDVSGFVEQKNHRIKEQISYLCDMVLLPALHYSGKKSIKVVNGSIQTRKTDKYHYPDDDVLLKFAKANCQNAVVVRESVNKNELKKYIKETGDIPEGLEVEEAESFSYTVNKGVEKNE